jgi:hypothetical protein
MLKLVFQGIAKAHDDHKWGASVYDVRTCLRRELNFRDGINNDGV